VQLISNTESSLHVRPGYRAWATKAFSRSKGEDEGKREMQPQTRTPTPISQHAHEYPNKEMMENQKGQA